MGIILRRGWRIICMLCVPYIPNELNSDSSSRRLTVTKKSLYWYHIVGTREKTDFKGFIDAYSCFIVLLLLEELIYSDIDVLHELSAIEGKNFGVFGSIYCSVSFRSSFSHYKLRDPLFCFWLRPHPRSQRHHIFWCLRTFDLGTDLSQVNPLGEWSQNCQREAICPQRLWLTRPPRWHYEENGTRGRTGLCLEGRECCQGSYAVVPGVVRSA